MRLRIAVAATYCQTQVHLVSGELRSGFKQYELPLNGVAGTSFAFTGAAAGEFTLYRCKVNSPLRVPSFLANQALTVWRDRLAQSPAWPSEHPSALYSRAPSPDRLTPACYRRFAKTAERRQLTSKNPEELYG